MDVPTHQLKSRNSAWSAAENTLCTGVSVGFSLVNCALARQIGGRTSVSNHDVSLAFLSVGRNGGGTRLCSRSSQLTSRKKGCALTSSASVGPAPRRRAGLRVSRRCSSDTESRGNAAHLVWRNPKIDARADARPSARPLPESVRVATVQYQQRRVAADVRGAVGADHTELREGLRTVAVPRLLQRPLRSLAHRRVQLGSELRQEMVDVDLQRVRRNMK